MQTSRDTHTGPPKILKAISGLDLTSYYIQSDKPDEWMLASDDQSGQILYVTRAHYMSERPEFYDTSLGNDKIGRVVIGVGYIGGTEQVVMLNTTSRKLRKVVQGGGVALSSPHTGATSLAPTSPWMSVFSDYENKKKDFGKSASSYAHSSSSSSRPFGASICSAPGCTKDATGYSLSRAGAVFCGPECAGSYP